MVYLSIFCISMVDGGIIMDVIEFRGRDLLGEWHYGNAVQEITGHTYLITGACGLSCYSRKQVCVNVIAIEIEADTVSQYTGLTDKYGIRIYENDILYDEYDETISFVRFDEGKFVVDYGGWVTDVCEINHTSWVRGNKFEDDMENEDNEE